MKILKRPLILASTLIAVTLLLSWKFNDDGGITSSSGLSNGVHLNDAAIIEELIAGDKTSPQTTVAEDVLVQRIPGDNDHLLIMAYYSKDNYSGASFSIESGYTIMLQDDGKGDDKVAGDGFYTAKISADVKAFREQVNSMNKQMKDKGYKPVHYHNRQKMIDADAAESFDLSKFDAHQPVSISVMTNALSEGFGTGATAQTSVSAGSTANRAVASSVSLTAAAALTSVPTTLDSIKKNSILITNLGVVEDPSRTWNSCTQKGNINGPWTFGNLMRELASKSPSQIASDSMVSEYIKYWLRTWKVNRLINGDTVAGRPLVDNIILNPWLSKSKKAGAPTGQLDMRFAPFKLIAIVNRFDLRGGQAFGVSASPCGEGRFVFCLIDPNCGGPLQFTVIFEYGINKSNTCQDQHTWAKQWVNLKNFPLGSAQYNQALQSITDQFTLCGTAPSKINQSSLSQLRTNEVALAPTTPSPQRWELREFILHNAPSVLQEVTVKQTAADKYNARVVNANVQRMASFVNTNQAKINAGTFDVPLAWQGAPFIGGASLVLGAATGNPPNVFHWDGTNSGNASTFITDDNARFNYSVQSCSGCHSGETQTAFTHINPVFFGREARLSGFLSGVKGTGGAIDFDHDSANLLMQVQDAAMRPSTRPTMRNFNDIDRRARDLQSVVSTSCGTTLAISSQLLFQPSTSVH